MRRGKRQYVFLFWFLCLGGLGLWCGEAAPGAPAAPPRHPPQRRVSHYVVSLQVPSAVFQHQTTPVHVQVRSPQGAPLDNIPVEFLLHPVSRPHALLLPGRTLTHAGQASAMLRANRVGLIHLTAHVGGLRRHADITVVLPVARLRRSLPGAQSLLAQLLPG
ncbi:MAG: hypothetical protein AB7N91_20690 [Candidatus Tectimicrobiota bacterium]